MRPRLLCLVSSLWMSLVLPSGTGAATDTDSQDGWGTVIAYVTEDGIPRCFANVVIDGTLWKGLTDETGICTITYLPGGKYTIHCLLMGFGEIRKPVTIIAGQTVQVSFEVQRRGDFHDDRYFEDLENCGPVSHLASKQATSSHGTGPSGLRRSESVLLTIPFEADTIRAIVTKVHDDVAPRWDSTATEIRFEDRRGDVLYRESVYAWDEWSDVLEEEITLSASVLHGDYGEVIELHNDPAPSTVRDPGSSRY
ncbi:MAG: carboxypeptidase-like regulatory domain-containing protein, partial [Candidatus Eisenbacteria bacterium]|nr:carboxypeptidase-like regulatory domain-containing protein [Candidatus Eisenbacteria bacterium]